MGDWSPDSHLGATDRLSHEQEPALNKFSRAITEKADPMTGDKAELLPKRERFQNATDERLAGALQEAINGRPEIADLLFWAATRLSTRPAPPANAVERVAREMCSRQARDDKDGVVTFDTLPQEIKDMWLEDARHVLQASGAVLAVPEGLTKEMCDAFWNKYHDVMHSKHHLEATQDAYAAMLAARPKGDRDAEGH